MNSAIKPSFNLTFAEIRTYRSCEQCTGSTRKTPNTRSFIFQCNPKSTIEYLPFDSVKPIKNQNGECYSQIAQKHPHIKSCILQ